MGHRQKPGRKSKGDRHQFVTRVPRGAAERAMAEARARDLSISEYLAIVIERAHGMDTALPQPVEAGGRQEELSISA